MKQKVKSIRKTTEYFQFTRERKDRSMISLEWIERVIAHPVKVEIQTDKRVRMWGWIEEEKKFLRVILLEDSHTLHNAFFDRRFSTGEIR